MISPSDNIPSGNWPKIRFGILRLRMRNGTERRGNNRLWGPSASDWTDLGS